MVLAFRPASLAMSRKLTPISVSGLAGIAGSDCGDWPNGNGRASESTSEKLSTSADRQRDRRNVRRDCDKRIPIGLWFVAGLHFHCAVRRREFASKREK